MLDDVYINTQIVPWLEFGPGIAFKTLRISEETGAWSVLFRCQAGASFRSHRHHGAGEYVMLKGKMEVRGGVENGGITAYAGDYGYEPNGILHEITTFPELTELYFNNQGPLEFLNDAGELEFILDWRMLEQLTQSAKPADGEQAA